MPLQNTTSSTNTHFITEVFSSIQGEGRYIGARQIFVRLSGCPVGCDYCDTDTAPKPTFVIDGEVYENPVTPVKLAAILARHFNLDAHHSISFTGGEPTANLPFLLECAEKVRNVTHVPLFLETSAYEPERLLACADLFRIFSIDVKMHSEGWREHLENLFAVLVQMPKDSFYLKLVIGNFMDAERTTALIDALKNSGIASLYIQSVDNEFNYKMIDGMLNLFYTNKIEAYYVPQIHKMLGVR